MQVPSAAAAATTPPVRDVLAADPVSAMTHADARFAQYKVIRRNGAVVGFEPAKITIAMTKAFLAVNGGQGAASARVREEVVKLTDAVVAALMKRKPEGGAIHIEEIQDQVELALMRGGEHEVARAYVLYRERRSQERAHEKSQKGGQGRARHPQRRRQRRRQAARSRTTHRAGPGILHGARRRRSGAHPQGHAEGSLRRRADGRSAQVRGAGGAHADREGSGVQLRHRAPAARLAPPRGAGRRGLAGARWPPVMRSISRSSCGTA